MMALAYFVTLLLLFLRLVFHRSVTNRRVTTEHGLSLSLSLSLFQQPRCQSRVCFHRFKIVFVGHCLLLRTREVPRSIFGLECVRPDTERVIPASD
jgi:hypothetical protein